jgi:hypothetical protein
VIIQRGWDNTLLREERRLLRRGLARRDRKVSAFNYGYKMFATVLLTPLYVAHGIVTCGLGVDPAPVVE